eukprot:g17973.t1
MSETDHSLRSMTEDGTTRTALASHSMSRFTLTGNFASCKRAVPCECNVCLNALILQAAGRKPLKTLAKLKAFPKNFSNALNEGLCSVSLADSANLSFFPTGTETVGEARALQLDNLRGKPYLSATNWTSERMARASPRCRSKYPSSHQPSERDAPNLVATTKEAHRRENHIAPKYLVRLYLQIPDARELRSAPATQALKDANQWVEWG